MPSTSSLGPLVAAYNDIPEEARVPRSERESRSRHTLVRVNTRTCDAVNFDDRNPKSGRLTFDFLARVQIGFGCPIERVGARGTLAPSGLGPPGGRCGPNLHRAPGVLPEPRRPGIDGWRGPWIQGISTRAERSAMRENRPRSRRVVYHPPIRISHRAAQRGDLRNWRSLSPSTEGGTTPLRVASTSAEPSCRRV
jgi:hypothetical protein